MFDVKNLSFPKFSNILKKRIFLSVIFEKKTKKTTSWNQYFFYMKN